jgi:hypothetical protein
MWRSCRFGSEQRLPGQVCVGERRAGDGWVRWLRGEENASTAAVRNGVCGVFLDSGRDSVELRGAPAGGLDFPRRGRADSTNVTRCASGLDRRRISTLEVLMWRGNQPERAHRARFGSRSGRTPPQRRSRLQTILPNSFGRNPEPPERGQECPSHHSRARAAGCRDRARTVLGSGTSRPVRGSSRELADELGDSRLGQAELRSGRRSAPDPVELGWCLVGPKRRAVVENGLSGAGS